jgi:hypothetical protein
LASEFSDPDGQTEGIVPQINVGDELVRGGVIPVDGDPVKLEKNKLNLIILGRKIACTYSTPMTFFEELLHPSQTVWI